MTDPVRIGLIGCGTISGAYLRAAQVFKQLEFVACADIVPEAAQRVQEKWNVRSMSVDELLINDEVEVVLNLTIPKAHVEVNFAALEAGKHTYSEKPFGLNVEDGLKVLEASKKHDLRVGCAPDTFLGGGHQTVRGLIDDGAIGRPLAGTAFMQSHGVEMWHPSPVFYYEEGGGPLFDMGPYYLTALVNSLGPVKRVAAITGKGFEQRLVTSKPLEGTVIDVEVDTHAAGTLEFVNGAIITVVMSFDVWNHTNHNIEVHGTDGSISIPDPNGFGGKVRTSGKSREWQEQELTHGYTDNMRSIGLADMCKGIRTNRPHRASGELAFHVLEIMAAFETSSTSGTHVEIESCPSSPMPLPQGLSHGELD
ncbi:MAG: Gfo/Idh/MocA family oxidoreductase [Gammaproteobacteria bacterium]|nr:Gfo/Idh/MocA family oxidoreductase [Gammaproteobacteria bacterium]